MYVCLARSDENGDDQAEDNRETAPRGELSDSLIELQRMGPHTVIITLGAAGSVGLQGDQLVQQGTFEVDKVDATGAGNVFHGAYVAGLLDSLPFDRCMELVPLQTH